MEDRFIKHSLLSYFNLVYNSKGAILVTFEEYLTSVLKIGFDLKLIDKDDILKVIRNYEMLIVCQNHLKESGCDQLEPTSKSEKEKIYDFLSDIYLDYNWFNNLYKNLQEAKAKEMLKYNKSLYFINYTELLSFIKKYINNTHGIDYHMLPISEIYDLYTDYMKIVGKIRYENNVNIFDIYLSYNTIDIVDCEKDINEKQFNNIKNTPEEEQELYVFNSKNLNRFSWIIEKINNGGNFSQLKLGLDDFKIPEPDVANLFGIGYDMLKRVSSITKEQAKKEEDTNFTDGDFDLTIAGKEKMTHQPQLVKTKKDNKNQQ